MTKNNNTINKEVMEFFGIKDTEQMPIIKVTIAVTPTDYPKITLKRFCTNICKTNNVTFTITKDR